MSTIRKTPRGRSAVDVAQHAGELRLVVDRVEHGDDVIGRRFVQLRHVLTLEGRVRQPQPSRFGAARRDPLVGEVDSGEPAVRERKRHHVDGMPTAATPVGHLDACPQPFGQSLCERQDDVDQGSVEHLAALFGHDRVETGVLAVGQAPAGAEAADDLRLDLAQQRDVLRDAGQVVGSGGAGQHRRVVRRKRVCRRRGFVVDHATGHHAAQPFPDVAFVESGGVGDLGAGTRQQTRHRVEQPGLMSDTGQDRDTRAVDRAHHRVGEVFGGSGSGGGCFVARRHGPTVSPPAR